VGVFQRGKKNSPLIAPSTPLARGRELINKWRLTSKGAEQGQGRGIRARRPELTYRGGLEKGGSTCLVDGQPNRVRRGVVAHDARRVDSAKRPSDSGWWGDLTKTNNGEIT